MTTLPCRTCGALVDVDSAPPPPHDLINRYNTDAGPGPFPFLILHSPWSTESLPSDPATPDRVTGE